MFHSRNTQYYSHTVDNASALVSPNNFYICVNNNDLPSQIHRGVLLRLLRFWVIITNFEFNFLSGSRGNKGN